MSTMGAVSEKAPAGTRDEEFTSFMVEALPTLTRAAWCLAGDEHRAADLVQQALVSTYVAWSRVRDPLSYVRRSMTNQWFNSTRNGRREVLAVPQEMPENGQADPTEAVAERDRLARALARLGARQRRVVVLRHVKGFSEKEVAEMLGVSVGTVKSTSSRGLGRLRAALEEESLMSDSAPSAPEPTIIVDTSAVVRQGRRRRAVRAAAATVAAVVLFVGAAAFMVLRPDGPAGPALPGPTVEQGATGVTVPEGATAAEIVDQISRTTGISVADFDAAIADPVSLGIPPEAVDPAARNGVEGWLAPGAYDVPPGATAAEVLTMMVKQTTDLLTARQVPQGDWQRVLIQASIVEREGGVNTETGEDYRPMVARVIANRLAADKPLEVDCTVLYGDPDPDVPLSEKNEDASNPYNLYKHAGLPPGPIASPGEASIDAVLNPAAGDWFYYVTINYETLETRFAVTFAEYQANVELLHQWYDQQTGTSTEEARTPPEDVGTPEGTAAPPTSTQVPPTGKQVPALTDKYEADAIAVLVDLGFQPNVVSEASQTVPKGRVVRVQPAVGTSLPYGATVTLIVSSGPS
ncbi:MAG: endolytic transglycosylase MltG [Micrococcales bacterium]|nr:endolytic transglycosylase MltG [Micrococcales bacterium]